ncbi:membrane protein insertase YidC/Oxa1 family [Clostridium sp. CAG:1000]|jgi:YidC/Oxa1 family membrane protein insertase|nr:membrane protein insertase YidC/Oxa1 family [Clostridium sp. CAG:1000]
MKKKILILFLMLFTLSGCTKRFNVVINEEKNQQKSYVSNILCKPETKELVDVYKNNDKKLLIKYEDLPKCSNLKINSGGYEGLWTSLFVKPLAWIIVKVGLIVKNYGLAIMIVGLILRLLMFPISKKSTNMNINMQKAQKDLDKLEKKYKGREDRDSMMAKSQEMMLIYKKYDINPFSSCLFAFLQLPIFFAFLEAVYRVPAFFEKNFLVFNLGTTPLEGIKAGNYWYIILVVIIILATVFSFKNMNMSTNKEQAKQMKMMTTFMIVFISFVSFGLPTSIALYWIVSNGFTVVQNLLLKKGK